MAGSIATRQVVFVLATALLSAGAWTAVREAAPYFKAGIDDAERFASLARAEPAPGPSIASERLVLDNCVRTLSSLYGRLQPSDAKNQVGNHCLAAADAAATRNPSSSYAWYVGAMAAARSGDVAGMNDRLAMSQETGPYEQWIAELRVPLAEDHFDELTPDVRAHHDRDLEMMVASRRGIATIAGRYVSQPTFRERITAIVETMPEADQRRFVGRVTSAAGQGGN